ncbi:MAG: dihydropyrimidinase [Bellilinea sp.]
MTQKTLLIQGGTVVNELGAYPADLWIEGEKIVSQAPTGAYATLRADETIEATGKLVLPGLIDPHLHFNSPFMGTITAHGYDNGTAAAAFGGVTTLIDFSTQPKGGSILQNVEQKEEEARGRAYIDWSVSGILLDAGAQTLAEIPQLIAAGLPTYKCFTTYKHSGRLMDDDSFLLLLEATAKHGGMLMVHCENDAIVNYHTEKLIASGELAPIDHARSRPASAENVAIQRVVDLMREVPAPVYIVHTSTAESAQIIQRARLEGLPIHSETCTHYLTLTEEKLKGPNSQLFICSPPLRKQKDVDALWHALDGGAIEVVSSDDAGVLPADNLRIGQGRFDKVPSGLTGIETRLSILYTEGVCKGRITLPQLVAAASSTPARLFGLYPAKGHLNPGADADVVLFDPTQAWTMSASTLHQNTDFCIFEGWPIQGKVETVISRGEYVIRNGELVGRPGRGQRVFRKL